MEEDVTLEEERIHFVRTSGRFPCYGTSSLQAAYQPEGFRKYYTHIVSEGDTITAIAVRYGVTVQDINAANHLWSSDSLLVHKTLLVPMRDNKMSPVNNVFHDNKVSPTDNVLSATDGKMSSLGNDDQDGTVPKKSDKPTEQSPSRHKTKKLYNDNKGSNLETSGQVKNKSALMVTDSSSNLGGDCKKVSNDIDSNTDYSVIRQRLADSSNFNKISASDYFSAFDKQVQRVKQDLRACETKYAVK